MRSARTEALLRSPPASRRHGTSLGASTANVQCQLRGRPPTPNAPSPPAAPVPRAAWSAYRLDNRSSAPPSCQHPEAWAAVRSQQCVPGQDHRGGQASCVGPAVAEAPCHSQATPPKPRQRAGLKGRMSLRTDRSVPESAIRKRWGPARRDGPDDHQDPGSAAGKCPWKIHPGSRVGRRLIESSRCRDTSSLPTFGLARSARLGYKPHRLCARCTK